MRLEIRSPKEIGYKSEVFLDGEKLSKVFRVDVSIPAEDLISIEIHQLETEGDRAIPTEDRPGLKTKGLRLTRNQGLTLDCEMLNTEFLEEEMKAEGWKQLIQNAVSDDRKLDRLALMLEEVDQARQSLINKGFGCTGMPLLEMIQLIPEENDPTGT